MSLFQGWVIPQPNVATLQHLHQRTLMLEQRLQDIATRFERVKFASSLAVEDMVISDAVARLRLPITTFTLQTGRLNPETTALITATEARYQMTMNVMQPDAAAIAAYEHAHGRDGFYDSVALRRECCRIRKIEPLGQAIQGADAWLTGQRREQSTTRTELALEEWDESHGLSKFNPLFDWDEASVWAYALVKNVPINALYHQHYPSIGCEPCTKPVRLGDDIRAGRWWWESQDSKECGLHK